VIVLAGGDLVLPGRILPAASLVVDAGRIVDIDSRPRLQPAAARIVDTSGCYVVPGFVDVHVHGVDGHDTLDGPGAIAQIAACLPRYGVTAFCPTTVACGPAELRGFLGQVQQARASRAAGSARVLPAHLESNFINPEYCGAQPQVCLRSPAHALQRTAGDRADNDGDQFAAADIVEAIAAARADVGIVTLAPELPGSLALIRYLVAAGHRVSLGHSGADFDLATAAIDAGARHATHLFNRMTPLTHRSPGIAGAILSRDDIVAELICDAYHVHPAMSRMAIAAKGVRGIMAITDGTGGAGLRVGTMARLGGRPIRVGEQAAFLADGTLAGSTLTMDRAFRNIVSRFGCSLSDAAMLCATTPAAQMGLDGRGAIAAGACADLVVLDRAFRVQRTFVDGEELYRPDT
jgi:N-acetylglucosamine-6-phosphate deacetylase